MKKTFLAFAVAAAAAVSLQGCDKIKEQAFNAITTNSFEFDVVIPPAPAGFSGPYDSVAIEMDVDKILRDNTGGVYSASSIGKITPEEIILTLNNADAENNLANFEQAAAAAWSSKPGATAVAVGTSNLSDIFASETRMEHDGSVNLKDYAVGNKLYYIMSIDARRATTKELTGKVKVKFKLDK